MQGRLRDQEAKERLIGSKSRDAGKRFSFLYEREIPSLLLLGECNGTRDHLERRLRFTMMPWTIESEKESKSGQGARLRRRGAYAKGQERGAEESLMPRGLKGAKVRRRDGCEREESEEERVRR